MLQKVLNAYTGPATANYDIDLGPLFISDWYYHTAAYLAYAAAYLGTGPPTADNGLVNGTMVSPDGTAGSYYTTSITYGKKYRIRIINTSVDNHFMVSLDSHPFQVITSDFVPITPYYADWVSKLGMIISSIRLGAYYKSLDFRRDWPTVRRRRLGKPVEFVLLGTYCPHLSSRNLPTVLTNFQFRAEVQDQAGCGANSNNGQSALSLFLDRC
jgi:hypothetical protein